jgi:hypothetical protein
MTRKVDVRRFEDAGSRGWFIAKGLGVVIAIALLGLVLDSFGVSFGGYIVLGAVGLFVIVFYIAPWWPSRR